ncbi:hypothetical protein NPIL_363181 [Nephila pilipes]|uniref:Uncharacterized protein n=1 Tax=Nephila pilipes TaxID=299642 RepID=A0A8X6Q6Z8_NEPPI|nr:hypothetical protein NPIL_363181 [Nephila pilipes]
MTNVLTRELNIGRHKIGILDAESLVDKKKKDIVDSLYISSECLVTKNRPQSSALYLSLLYSCMQSSAIDLIGTKANSAYIDLHFSFPLRATRLRKVIVA